MEIKRTRPKQKRPTCKECGLVKLRRENQFVIDLVENHFRSIVSISGFGGWSINVEAVELLAWDKVDDFSELLRRLEKVLETYLKVEDKESDGR